MEGPRILPAAETLTLHGVLRGSVHGADAVDLTAPVLAGALGAAARPHCRLPIISRDNPNE